jgi:hypothetical protein
MTEIKLDGDKIINIGEIESQNRFTCITVRVTESFLNVLKQPPLQYRRPGPPMSRESKRRRGNAYVFGPIIENSDYIRLGYHGNDVAQTGVLDATDMKDDEYKQIRKLTKWHQIYHDPNTKECTRWDDQECLKKVQAEISPRVLFVGETDGGDYGATVYAHINDKNEIDSLAIDNTYFSNNDILKDDAEKIQLLATRG